MTGPTGIGAPTPPINLQAAGISLGAADFFGTGGFFGAGGFLGAAALLEAGGFAGARFLGAACFASAATAAPFGGGLGSAGGLGSNGVLGLSCGRISGTGGFPPTATGVFLGSGRFAGAAKKLAASK